MAWGKVKQFLRAWFSRPLSSTRVPVFNADTDRLWWEDNPNDGWQFQAMHYTPQDVTPGNHP